MTNDPLTHHPDAPATHAASPHVGGGPLFELATGSDITHREYRLHGRTRFVAPLAPGAADRGLDVFLRRRHRAVLNCHQWWLRLSSGVRPAQLRETRLLQELKAFLGLERSHSVLSVGTPGPHEKNTLVFVGDSGTPGPIVKVATSPAAAALLQNEAKWLERLGRSGLFRAHVPQLLWAGARDTAYLLVQSCRRGKRTAEWAGPPLARFLARLQETGVPRHGFTGSRMHRDMRRRHDALRPRFGAAWNQRVEATLAMLESTLDEAAVPMVVAHRDFAPWNVRLCDGEPWVFDWEYASEEYVPQYDRFHFELYPLAKGGVWRQGALQRALRVAADSSRTTRDRGPGAAAGLMAYLLDVSLSHLERDLADGQNGPIVRNYFMLMDALEMCPSRA